MKNKILLTCLALSFLFLVSACGKMGGEAKPANVQNKIGRDINPQLEGDFSAEEKNLGLAFCNSLKFKRENFVNLHADPNAKKFRFEVSKMSCGSTDKVITQQDLYYSSAGGLSYTGSGSLPTVQTDSQGVYATYCANRTQNARTYTVGSTYVSYHFFDGTQCGGSATDVCAIMERAEKGGKTNAFKQYLISTDDLFGLSLKGQEKLVIDQSKCGDEATMTQAMDLKGVE